MSERPQADTATRTGTSVTTLPPTQPPTGLSIDIPVDVAPADATPHTVERPEAPKKPSWSGLDRYPDGYEMERHPDQSITLKHPDGSRATWDSWRRDWIGADGEPMPPGWSGGHEPMTQTLTNS